MSQRKHIDGIFGEYTTPSRVLRSFTNLSNTVIQTALSGQSKFLFEILQNADDAFEDPNQQIEVHFILEKNYFIVHHNGKGFDYNDVERICDYASQIEEVKATDLSKTGYKGLGFKSLFNLSECIYICSNGYSFRFDKGYWPDSESKPWQVIPIWCDSLPLSDKFAYDQSVNFILKISDKENLIGQLLELINHPELFLFLHRIHQLRISLNGKGYVLERKTEKFGNFNNITFYNNKCLVSNWFLATYEKAVPSSVQSSIRRGSKFVYPDKIKTATKVPFTFSLQIDDDHRMISKIKGVLYSTLPTQLHLTLPYHINSLFVLNLDRTQLHENEWNVFLVQKMGYLQLMFLKDLAQMPGLKNYVIELFVRKISHPYATFCAAFLKGFKTAKNEISWIPAHKGRHLLKIGEAWIDETEFFKMDFKNIRDKNIEPHLIDYDIRKQTSLLSSEAKRFTYDQLLKDFRSKYYPQLNAKSHKNFISFLYEKSNTGSFGYNIKNSKLRNMPFLRGKNRDLLPPEDALLEDDESVPEYFLLNTVDTDYLHESNMDSLKDWLVDLGAKRLSTPNQIIRESILKWIDSNILHLRVTTDNHLQIMKYLAENADDHLNTAEKRKLRENLIILTKGNQFKLAKDCYLCDAVVIKELEHLISDEDKISPSYNTDSLRNFFIEVGVKEILPPVDVLRKSILTWIENDLIKSKITADNYFPIIDYFALHYPKIKNQLEKKEIQTLESMLVLTCSQTFQKAKNCYLDTSIPKVKGFESIIQSNKLVPTNTLSASIKEFLVQIGVSSTIDSETVLRLSVLKWITDGVIKEKITADNHLDILGYIAEHWDHLQCGALKDDEKKSLRRFPILTKSNCFRETCCCYWPESENDMNRGEKIPGIESLILAEELVSAVYEPKKEEKKLNDIKFLIKCFGVKSIKFTDVYEKYSDQLNNLENQKWFFSHLISYWKSNKWNKDKDKLLKFVQQKFTSSGLLAKDGKVYCSKELYSSHFYNIHKFSPDVLHLLDYDDMPKDLEKWLGFKDKLELSCMLQLLEAIDRQTELGETETVTFFKTLLEQLKLKAEVDIKKHNFKLLSQDNKLQLASDLYYFKEEDAVCVLDSCYLKRIHGMSHDDTLKLASLCGVNLLPFKREISFGETPVYDRKFKEFCLKRLPFIVLQESKKLNESPVNILKLLYIKVNAIELYQCSSILLQYPFGDPTNIGCHFEDSKIYVFHKWKNFRSQIYEFVKENLCLATNITNILDLDTIEDDDISFWLDSHKEDPEKFTLVVEELQKLLLDQEETYNEDLQEVLSDNEETYLLTSFENLNLRVTPQKRSKKCKPMGDKIKSRNEHRIDRTDVENEESDSRIVSVNKQKSLNLNLEKLLSLEEQLSEFLSKIEFQQGNPFFKHKRNFNEEEHDMNEDSATGEYYEGCDRSGNEEKFHLITEVLQQLLHNPEKLSLLTTFIKEEVPINIDEENSTESYSNALLSIGHSSTPRRRRARHSKRSPRENQYSRVPLEVSNLVCNSKWLNEKFVYTLLQEHYINKYPGGQAIVEVGYFTLIRDFTTIEIYWLNEDEDSLHPHDLLLKKDGEVKQFIEVMSSDEINDSFNLNNSRLIAYRNQLDVDISGYKSKHCIYHVFNKRSETASSSDHCNNISALFKIVPINI